MHVGSGAVLLGVGGRARWGRAGRLGRGRPALARLASLGRAGLPENLAASMGKFWQNLAHNWGQEFVVLTILSPKTGPDSEKKIAQTRKKHCHNRKKLVEQGQVSQRGAMPAQPARAGPSQP